MRFMGVVVAGVVAAAMSSGCAACGRGVGTGSEGGDGGPNHVNSDGSVLGTSSGVSSSGIASSSSSSSGAASSSGGLGIPTLTFIAPANDGTHASQATSIGETVTFTVTVTDDVTILPQNGAFTVRAPDSTTSQSQGTVGGTGMTIQASLAFVFTSSGEWTVTYAYADADNHAVSTSIAITVSADAIPTIDITAPANNATSVIVDVEENASLTFRATVADNLAILPQNLAWTFTSAAGARQTSQGTVNGAGSSVTTTFVVADVGAAGNATVSLSYTDVSSGTASAVLTVPVLTAGTPSVVLTRPANDGLTANASVRVGTLINFQATISDDAAIIPANLQWTLIDPASVSTNYPGSFTAGGTATTGTATLAATLGTEGTWTARIAYTDAQALSRSVQITLSVVANAPPTCAFIDPGACLMPGAQDVDIRLDDPDGDVPITVTITSSNAADTIAPANVSGDGRLTLVVTLTGTGTRTLTCTPTDSQGRAGSPTTLELRLAGGAPTVNLSAPTDGDLVTNGANVQITVTSTTDALNQPSTVIVTDSLAGTIAIDGTGNGTVTAPLIGFHEVRATITDACLFTDRDGPVRYTVTAGGQPASTLVRTSPVTFDVRATVPDDNGTFALATNGDGLRAFDPANAGSAPTVDPSDTGDNLPATDLTTVSFGAASTGGDRLEAYGSADGVLLCVRASGATDCTLIDEGTTPALANNQVRSTAIAGTGVALNEAFFVVASSDGAQIFDVNAQEVLAIAVDAGADTLPDEPTGVAVDPTGTDVGAGTPPGQRTIRLWIATRDGVVRLTASPPPDFANVALEIFDDNNTNDGLPGNNVRALAIDPGDPEQQWFVTDAGLSHHTGPSTEQAAWKAWTTNNAPLPSNNLRAVLVDRFPSSSIPVVWVGTDSSGAFRFDAHDELLPLVTRITTGDGLPDPRVNSIAIHPDGTAHIKWFGTPGGLWGYAGN